MSSLSCQQSPKSNSNQGTTGTGGFNIFIKLRTGPTIQVGKTIILNVEASNTLNDIKAKIQDVEGIAPEHQLLTFQALFLPDGCLTLADCDIQDESTLYLHEQWVITIRNISGKEHAITAFHETSINFIKHIISEKEGLDVTKIQLLLDSVILKDWQILAAFNVQRESVLTMVITEPTA